MSIPRLTSPSARDRGRRNPVLTRPTRCAGFLVVFLLTGCSGDQNPAAPQSGSQTRPVPYTAVTKVGDVFPYTSFVGQDGTVVDLTKRGDGKKSLLVFMRGFSGFVCPYCTAQTAELVKRRDEILATNTELYVVYPGAAETIPTFLEAVRVYMASEDAPGISVLMDVDLKAVDALGIRQDLSRPCTFVLDAEGRLVYEYVGEGPPDRPSLDDVLQVLKANTG